jgi:hypothetical protein
VENVRMIGFFRSVNLTGSGHISLRDVRAENCTKGFFFGGTVNASLEGSAPGACLATGSGVEGFGTVGSAVVSVKNCAFTGNGTNGVRVTASSSVSIQGGSVVANGVKSSSYSGDVANVFVKESAKLVLAGTAAEPVPISQAGNSGCGLWIQNVDGPADVSLDHVQITNNGCGIYHQGGALSLSNVLVSDSAEEGISLYSGTAPSSAKLRNVVVRDSGRAGIHYSGSAVTLDLGTVSDPGQVSFKDNLKAITNYASTAQLANLTTT